MPLVHRRAHALVTAASVVVLAILLAAAPLAPAGAAPAPPAHRPPVEAAVADGFRPPVRAFGPQNLGLEYATEAGTPVRASAEGTVSFAGRTPTGLWLTLDHPDGLRTSYGPLTALDVRAGAVRQGAVVGTTAGHLHFSVRLGDAYLDPALVLAGWAPDVRLRLIPGPLRPGAGDELARQRLAELDGGLGLGDVVGGLQVVVRGGELAGVLVAGAAQAVADEAFTTLRWAREVRIAIERVLEQVSPEVLLDVVADWWEQRGRCTPRSVAPPPPGPQQAAHLVVLVAGIGSSSNAGAVDDVDVGALGFDPAHVLRFSYAGGVVPDPADGPAARAGLAVQPYGPTDTHQPVDTSAARLRALLAELAVRHPGVPVDVVGHSLGGVVALRALQAPAGGGALPADLSLVTLGSPLGGSTMAGASGILADGPGPLSPALSAATEAVGAPPADAPAVRDLAPGSGLMHDLHGREVPAGVDVTAIAGRFDATVASTDTHMPGVEPVVVDAGRNPLTAHAQLPGHAATTREVALALAGMDPTCRTLLESFANWGTAFGTTALTSGAAIVGSGWGASGPPTSTAAGCPRCRAQGGGL